MASSRKPKPTGGSGFGGICAATTPGPLGIRDHADPNVFSWFGDSPGPLGINDHGQPSLSRVLKAPSSYLTTPTPSAFAQSTQSVTYSPQSAPSETPLSGTIPVGMGMPSVIRIAVPGTDGLFVSLSPRGFIPKGGSTSALFIQDITGKRHLRLDYGYNKGTGNIDYHWNQKGTYGDFGIADHTAAGTSGEAIYKGAKYFKYAGRALLVVGAAIDVYSIVVAKKRWRQATKVVAGWAGAWAGAEAVGAIGAGLGSVEPGGGTAVGGILFGLVGGIGGYFGASWAAETTYDWVEETYFVPLEESSAPK